MKFRTELNPSKRTTSADREINRLNNVKQGYLRQRQEKQIELDVINSEISSVEAQIANIVMHKPKMRKEREKCRNKL